MTQKKAKDNGIYKLPDGTTYIQHDTIPGSFANVHMEKPVKKKSAAKPKAKPKKTAKNPSGKGGCK